MGARRFRWQYMVKLFIEGGGQGALAAECREAFKKFLEKTELKGKLPRIVACGPRWEAYDSFKNAIENNEKALLLVDSEDPVHEDHKNSPWTHLNMRTDDKYDKPNNATEESCHFMSTCMETWFLADKDSLKNYYGSNFNVNILPVTSVIEEIRQKSVERKIHEAAKNTKKRGYKKKRDSFKILQALDVNKVIEKCFWAKRLIDCLR